jgi:hypothetical protein
MGSAEISLCEQSIVRSAQKSKIWQRWRAAERVRQLVVELQKQATVAASARVIDEAASITITHRDGSPDVAGDVLAPCFARGRLLRPGNQLAFGVRSHGHAVPRLLFPVLREAWSKPVLCMWRVWCIWSCRWPGSGPLRPSKTLLLELFEQ